MATQTRKLEQLPLNEEKRIALRESQESKALAIENKRRVAKGEAPLTSLDEEEEAVEQGETDEVAEVAEQNDDTVADVSDSSEDTASETADSDEDETPDVLLTEAGNVLVDALVLKKTHYAANVSEKE